MNRLLLKPETVIIQDVVIWDSNLITNLYVLGDRVGIKRRSFFFFKEPSFIYKKRIKNKGIKMLREQFNQ